MRRRQLFIGSISLAIAGLTIIGLMMYHNHKIINGIPGFLGSSEMVLRNIEKPNVCRDAIVRIPKSSGIGNKGIRRPRFKTLVLPNLNTKQERLLKYAYRIARIDGHHSPEIFQGILWHESRVGEYPSYKVRGDEFGLRFGKRYYGIGQIKLSAARDVIKRYPELGAFKTNDELMAALIHDDEFNIRVASKYYKIVSNGNEKFSITAYNQGRRGASRLDTSTWNYTEKVIAYSAEFEKLKIR